MESMFYINKLGQKEFREGKEAWAKAKCIAEKCTYFKLDAEDEWVADDQISCYNCRYRRWTSNAFTCCK